MQTKLATQILAVAMLSPLSIARAQQSIAPQNATADGTVGRPTSASPATATASVYVYWKGSMLGHHSYLFINDKFVGVLGSSTYAKSEVSPGTAVVAVTGFQTSREDIAYLHEQLPPSLTWPKCEGSSAKATCIWDNGAKSPDKEDHGCGRIDWTHVEAAPKQEVDLCKNELDTTSASLDSWMHPHEKAEAIFLAGALPGIFGPAALGNALSIKRGDRSWLQMCGVNSLPSASSPEGKQILTNCRHQVAAIFQLLYTREWWHPIETEAGKSYYFRWAAGGKLKPVDAITGGKEIGGLHPAKD